MKKSHFIGLFVVLFLLIVPDYVFASTYEYDELNRLKVVIYDNGDKEEYFYDENGNITEIRKTYAEVILESISLDKESYSLRKGDTYKVSVKGKYTDGSEKDITSSSMFVSSSRTIFKVSNNGTITAVGDGQGVIKAISNGKEITALVTVSEEDKEAPTIPTNFKCYSKGVKSIRLSWNGSTDNEKVDKYYVYLNGVKTYETKNMTFFKCNFQPATTYSFRVSAVDTNGNESGLSDEVVVTTDNEVIADPSIPSEFKCYYKGAHTIRLSWEPSKGTNEIEKYVIYLNGVKRYETDKCTFGRVTFLAGTTYKFKISAVDINGNESPLSQEIVVTTNDE